MIKLIALVGFALSLATSAEAMTPAPVPQPDSVITWHMPAVQVGPNVLVFVWQELPSAITAAPCVGVHIGMVASAAAGTSERGGPEEIFSGPLGFVWAYQSESMIISE